MVLSAEGRHDDAVLDINRAREKLPACQLCYLTDLAAIYRRAGQTDSAIAVYERIIAEPALGIQIHVPDVARLANLYRLKGDAAQAARYYARVADLWKDADPALQARVAAARQRAGAAAPR
jgi:tetratricopeptide (TPR) repeat protein